MRQNMFMAPATETRLIDLNTAGRIVIILSLAVHVLGHGWTAINLLDQEQPVHRDDCSFIWEHDDKEHQLTTSCTSLVTSRVYGRTMGTAVWIFPDVEGQYQKNVFSSQGSLNVLSFDSLTAGHCNLGHIRQ